MHRLVALLSAAISLWAFGASADPEPGTPRAADYGVAGVRLLSPKSFTSILGDDVLPFDVRLPGAQYTFRNAESTELLVLYQASGATRYSISEFSIQRLSKPEVTIFPGEPAHFRTARGIRLGISRPELERILGKPTRESDETLHYRLEPATAPAWLASFNMPYYESSYSFVDGRLVGILFGFPDP